MKVLTNDNCTCIDTCFHFHGFLLPLYTVTLLPTFLGKFWQERTERSMMKKLSIIQGAEVI